MPSHWSIQFWPACEKHVFLSHCAEDRENLVLPVYDLLQQRQIIPWIDRHHYPIGRRPFSILQEELLKCRHVIYFITNTYLRQGRGWCSTERAYSEIIQQQLCYRGDQIGRFELPLYFVRRDEPRLVRSTWNSLAVEKAVFLQPAIKKRKRWSQHHIQWAAEQIENFYRQEEVWAREVATRITQDPQLAAQFSDDNLRRRIIAESPRPLSLDI